MIGLEKLQRATTRKQRQKQTILIIIGSILAIFILIVLLGWLFTPATPQQKPTLTPEQMQKIDDNIREYFASLNKEMQQMIDGEIDEQRIKMREYQEQRRKEMPTEQQQSTLFDTFYSPTPVIRPSVSTILALRGACHAIPDFYKSVLPDEGTTSPDTEEIGHAHSTLESSCFPCPVISTHEGPGSQQISTEDGKLLQIPVEHIPSISTACTLSTTEHIAAVECQDSYYTMIFTRRTDPEGGIHNDPNNPAKIAQSLHFIPCEYARVDGEQAFWAIYGVSFVVMILSAIVLRWRLEVASQKMMSKIR